MTRRGIFAFYGITHVQIAKEKRCLIITNLEFIWSLEIGYWNFLCGINLRFESRERDPLDSPRCPFDLALLNEDVFHLLHQEERLP